MSVVAASSPPAIDPRRYHDSVEAVSSIAARDPVCLYLETTNRCNLLCTTCPRTYADLEPEADMSWELFTRIVDQVPNIARVVLHGVGEPMLVKELPRMVRYLKQRGAYVLFNTNGTVLTPKKGRELADTGLDELRVSLDAADAKTFMLVRGKDYFNRIVRNVRAFTEMQAREGLAKPRVSLWLTGLKETIAQLSDFVRIAHDIGVKEVYLQRLVYFEQRQHRHGAPRPGAVRAARPGRGRSHRGRHGLGDVPGHQLQRVRGDRARGEPRAPGRQEPLVAVPAAVDGDVLHRQRPVAALLHRAVLAEGLRELHAGRCHAVEPARDLERPGLPDLPRRAAVGCAAQVLRQLRPALEPVGWRPTVRDRPSPHRSSRWGEGRGEGQPRRRSKLPPLTLTLSP